MSGPSSIAARARVWECGRFTLSLDHTLVMGVLNVTPDSFSDGGEHDDPAVAVSFAIEMAADGADIIDIGGESTRPGSEEVPPAEEIARILPVIERLHTQLDIPLSIDTRHAQVAIAAVEAGASIVNDVAGFSDPAMVEVVRANDVGVVIMHMLGEPKMMQDAPEYDDVVTEVRDYLLDRALALEEVGVVRKRICIDPGIGFGKSLDHNLALLRGLSRLTEFGYPVLVGASRKRMIGEITGVAQARNRLGGSLAAATWAAEYGAAVVRVHDVAATVQAVTVADALAAEPDGSVSTQEV